LAVIVLIGCSGTSTARHKSSTTTGTATTSTSTPTTTSTTVPATRYRVRRGDTLGAIAARFHVTVGALVARNHLANPDRIAEGQTLIIPPAVRVELTISPRHGPAGQAFHFTLRGAVPGDTVRFETDSTTARQLGPPHNVPRSGIVIATFATSPEDAVGTYTVTATSNLSASVRAVFVIVAAAPSTT
jgi:LysM repeat protein